MHNAVVVLENDTHKLLWDFELQTDHLIWPARPKLITINKKKVNLQNCGLCCRGWFHNKTERKWKELPENWKKKLWNMKGDNYTNLDWCFWYCHQRIIKGAGGFGDWMTNVDYLNCRILENDQNTEKMQETWRDLLSLKLQLMVISYNWCGKTPKEQKYIRK